MIRINPICGFAHSHLFANAAFCAFHTIAQRRAFARFIPMHFMAEKGEQVVEAPVTVPAQVEVTPPVIEKVEIPLKKEEAAIPQSEWQKSQEQIKEQAREIARINREKFEDLNPIVKTEKYKDKWAEIVKLKETSGHKYSGLDHHELLNLIRDPTYVPEVKAPASPVPSMHFSAAPDVPAGEASQTVTGWLSMRYSKEQIAKR